MMMKNLKSMTVALLFLLYVYVLLKVILFKFGSVDIGFLWQQLQRTLQRPETIQNGLQRANFIPFESILQNIRLMDDYHNFINFFGNIAIFIPCGLLTRLWSNQTAKSFLLSIALSFGLSLWLECAQMVFSMGSFDVDDLILNSFGGLLGWGLSALIYYSYARLGFNKMLSET